MKEATKKRATLSANIEQFVEDVLPLTDGRKIWNRWASELSKYKDKTDSTKKLYTSKYKAAVKAANPDHKALDVIKLTRPKSNAIRQKYRQSVATQNKELIHFPQWKQAISWAKQLIQEGRHTEIGLGLCLLTGRRPYEVFCTGEFDYYFPSDGARAKYIAQFKGQAKLKDSREDEYYPIPLLTDISEIIDAYERLRAALPDLAGADNKTFNVRMGTATSRKMKSLVSDFWPDGDEPTPSKLRPLYAEIAFKLYPNLRFDMSKAGFFAAILGHDHNDVTTSLSYMDYYLDDKRTAKKVLDHTQKDAQNRIRSWDETEVKTGKKK